MRRILCLPAVFLIASSAAIAEEPYPSKPIRFIVPYPPGGVVDIRARELADCLPKSLGQTVVVENRAGAGGAIGTGAAAAAPADGYTVLVAASSQMVFEPLLNPNVTYDPERDFVAVAGVMRAPFFLVVNPALGAKSVKDFVSLAQSKPGSLAYGSAGVGTSGGMVSELFNRSAKLDLTHVPYKGDAQALADLMGGHIHAQFITYPVIAESVKAGRVRALMQTGDRRIAIAPDIPTAKEAGYPEVSYYGWVGVFLPSKTARSIVDRLSVAATKCLDHPTMKRRLEESGNEQPWQSLEQFAEFASSERAKWRKRINDQGLGKR